MAPAWEAAAKGPERSNAFIAVLQGDAPDIVDNWAESYLRQGLWQDPWIMYGFGLPDAAQVTQHPAQAQSDPGWTGSVNSRANTVLDVTSTSGEVVTVTTDGLASVHDGGSDSYTAFQTQRFCTADSCVCPQGTLLAGQDMASQHLAIPFVAAFNGAVGGSKYAIIADTLDDLCKHPATPEPAGTPNYGPVRSQLRPFQRRPAHADRQQVPLRLPGRRRVHSAPVRRRQRRHPGPPGAVQAPSGRRATSPSTRR